MVDENNVSGQEANVEPKVVEAPATQAPDTSEKPNVSAEEQARRDAQSAKDRDSATNDKDETINYLMQKEAERERDTFVSNLLTSSTDYPDVSHDDPMFKYATSQDEVEEIAKELQNRFKTVQQQALASVHEGDQSLTDEQIAEKEVELEKEANENGKSTFGSYLSNLQRRKK